jgi:hypothetical protein
MFKLETHGDWEMLLDDHLLVTDEILETLFGLTKSRYRCPISLTYACHQVLHTERDSLRRRFAGGS